MLVARGLASSHAHLDTAAVGTLTSPVQVTAAKFSDAVIVSAYKTLMRGTNDSDFVGAFFDATGCTFSSVTSIACPAKRYLADAAWVTCSDSAHRGPNTWCASVGNFNQSTLVNGKMYIYGGTNIGCRAGMQVPGSPGWCSVGGNGAFWVK